MILQILDYLIHFSIEILKIWSSQEMPFFFFAEGKFILQLFVLKKWVYLSVCFLYSLTTKEQTLVKLFFNLFILMSLCVFFYTAKLQSSNIGEIPLNCCF
jgi:hypothetical protein